MRPIRDIAAVRPDSVLYHSAFGFARVIGIGADAVDLDWQRPGENLPRSVSSEALTRVYALCPTHGFFHRALHREEELRQLLQVDPAQGMELLLEDLQGPQRRDDIRDWLVSRGLLSERSFPQWWSRLVQTVSSDDRFHLEQDTLYLESSTENGGPVARLTRGSLSPGRRLEIVLAHSDELDERSILEQIALAWKSGGSQIRDLALKATEKRNPNDVLAALLAPGPSNIEALIHFIRRARHGPEVISTGLHERLLDRVLQGIQDGSPLDNEGRLAAALLRWGCNGAVERLASTANLPDGRRLLRATFAALPPRRGEAFALAMLEAMVPQGDEGPAQWLAQEALAFGLIDADEMQSRLEQTHPGLAEWYAANFHDVPGQNRQDYDEYTDDTAFTAELDLGETLTEPVCFADLSARSGITLLSMGLAMARALAQYHKLGSLASPTETHTELLPDGSIRILAGDPSYSPRPLIEDPSAAADVFAAAVLLVQAMFKRRWPRNLPPSRVIPYLRTIVPLLPPSTMAPLEIALHPDPNKRPADGLTWLAMWQKSAVAEETRNYTLRNASARVRWGLDTHVGRQKALSTQTNQDAVYAATEGNRSLLVVCDGISTANAGSGDLASGIASQIIANLWEQALPRLSNATPSELRDFLDRALRIANQAVCEAALRFAGGNIDGRVPMGTTAVVAVTHGNWMSIAWLGDSRAYLIGPYGASILTADDNQAGDRLRSWHLGYADSWEPGGYALVGYVGHFNELSVPEPIPAHHVSFSLNPGERLVLCSDGVTDYLADTPPEVSRILYEVIGSTEDLDQAAREVISLSNAGGGGDNASVLVGALQGS